MYKVASKIIHLKIYTSFIHILLGNVLNEQNFIEEKLYFQF